MRYAAALVLAVGLAGLGCSSEGSPAPQTDARNATVGTAQAASPTEVPPPVKAPAQAAKANAPTPAAANANAALPAAAETPPPAKPAYAAVLIKDVPHIQQKTDFCGEACAAMFLKRLGWKGDQDDVFNVSGVDPLLGRGCYTSELAAALVRIGFKAGGTGAKVPAARAAEGMETQWRALYNDLDAGRPSIVCMHYDVKPGAPEHFRLILGYDPSDDTVVYNEPAEADGAYRHMKRADFLALWPLKYTPDSWTVIRLPLEPRQIADPAPRSGFTPADYAQHVMVLKKKVPAQGFSLALAPPFVVVGDQPLAAVKVYADKTVTWAVKALKADFFRKDPDEILDIWLFNDDLSYRKYAKEIFGDTPTTPYGYFSSQHGALIMNIGTGGGTLVHEIVHPFMWANFPECPDWFNEGMGSLYEQSQDRLGHISGLTNWRLAGLQKVIAAKDLPTFKTLCSTTNSQFYKDDAKGTNYAQARYLCYYLQEQGLLVKFYREFVANHKVDPTGYKTLQRVLAEPDMAAFQKRWEDSVMKLKFPS
jgi:hypothetical protein